MAEAPSTFAVLQQLRDLGVRVLLDDFGTGYSSLGYLHRFPLDGVKIDRTFATDLGDGRAVPIVEAVVKMAQALGLDVVAEGVEGVDEARRLRRLGCAVAQGFVFAPPLEGAELEDALRTGVVNATTDGAFGPVQDGRRAGAPTEPWLRGEDATMTLGEAAQALDVSASTLRRWADSGRLTTVRTGGGHRRFARAEIARLAGRSVEAPRVRPPADAPGATPAAAEVLEVHRNAVARLAAQSIYEDEGQGWLAGSAAAGALEHWSLDLAAACRSGDEDAAVAAVLRLFDDAADAGASLVEVDAFLGSALGLLVRELQRRHADEAQIADVRRLFGRLRRRVLAHAQGA
jgi:excisionase family DNA binding protein